ncbi:uncharacterized [Tachysurus ichikawai]
MERITSAAADFLARLWGWLQSSSRISPTLNLTSWPICVEHFRRRCRYSCNLSSGRHGHGSAMNLYPGRRGQLHSVTLKSNQRSSM